MEPLIECVPNFSEGRDRAVIGRIADAIAAVEGVELLDVDPGAATNRTVVTFAGAPGPVIEGALVAGRMAKQWIDMRRHHGEHPRFGAMDVCPLVPISGISMAETVEHARELARRLGEEVGVGVYCYEHAALQPERRNLAVVRAGEYEGLTEKLSQPEWWPDFGPTEFDPGYGVTAVGARDFLIAYNVNLNTTSTRRANAVAYDVREKGRRARSGDPLTGPLVRDAGGNEVWQPGSLRCVKAIGWFIEEYGLAQISMNLTDIGVTPLHVAFDEVCEKARLRGIRVTGSEIVGLVPLRAMLDAGRHFLRKQRRSLGVPERELVRLAVKSMGLDELAPFDPDAKVIEYVLEKRVKRARPDLVDRSVADFTALAAGEAPAPGGGSVAALCGSLGGALAAMVANLSSHKRGWDDRWEEFSQQAEAGERCRAELLRLVDEDTRAFDRVLVALGQPKGSDEERAARERAIEDATRGACEVPLRTMEVATEVFDLALAMVRTGLETAASDAGVAGLCARAAVLGGGLNVRINAAQLHDAATRERLLGRAAELEHNAGEREREILEAVRARC